MEIPFNRPYLTGREKEYIEDVLQRRETGANGYYTREVTSLLEEKFSLTKVLMTTSCTHALEMAIVIHSCLSPCADLLMTPGNIIKEALKLGLDCIAITDHNTAGNVEPALKIAQNNNLIVIPGMELESVEEVHLLCYFPGLAEIKEWELIVQSKHPALKNNETVFGYQLLTDENDEYIAKEERLLATATKLSVSQIAEGVSLLGGIVVPAHVDKTVNSIIGQLGFIPPELNPGIIEISRNTTPLNFFKVQPLLKDLAYLRSSDSHYLQDIGCCGEQYKGFYLEKPIFNKFYSSSCE